MALHRLLCFPLQTPLIPNLSHLLSPPSSSSSLSAPSKIPISNPLFQNPFPIKPKTHFSSLCTLAAVSVQSPQIETQGEEASGRTRLIAQNVPWDSSADDIRALFEKYGTVLDVELSMHNSTRNRGLVFVTMGSPEEAVAALTQLESYEFEGRVLKVNYARSEKKKPSPPTPPKAVSPYNLFVANLSYEARAKDLKEFFNTGSGRVVSAEVVFHDNPRKSSGYGFVSFRSKEDAEGALSNFQGKMFMGRPIRLARSKRFLKQGTEVKNQPDDISESIEP